VFSGFASFYGNESGRRTASGQRFDQNELSCAHPSLPFGTKLRVTYGGRSVVVTVNDRGPFIRGRALDLSTAAARAVGLTSVGIGRVTGEVISLSDGVWRAPARKSTGTRFGLERLQIVSKQGECRGNDLPSLFLPRQHSTLVGAFVGPTSARTSTTALAIPPGFTACRNNTATVSPYFPQERDQYDTALTAS
jgi:rare lipoprotein A (peptidoglycan hydrolase)